MFNLRESIATNKFIVNFYKKYNEISDKFNYQSKFNKINLIIFILMLSFIFILSVNSRFEQLNYWNEHRDIFYTKEGTPMMTTLDAYKFIRHAKENREGTYDPKVLDTKIFYPDNSPFPNPLPLLSYMLDKISSLLNYDYYITALYMIPFMSSLFIIPLGIYFFLIGYPVIGILAGFITSYAPVFYNRTFIGRFDTDGLNLFFLFTASIFLYLLSKSKTPLKMYINSAILGVTIFLFYRFYHHGTFNIIFLLLIFICLYISNAKWKDILISMLIYVILSNPVYLYTALYQTLHALNVYIFGVKTDALATIFPNVYETISEAKKEPILFVLISILNNTFIVILGLIGITLFAIFNIKNSLPLAPVALVGLMSFISSGRFAMYLAPVVGAGIGYIFYLLAKLIFSFNKTNNLAIKDEKLKKINEIFKTYTPYVFFIVFFMSVITFHLNSFGFIKYRPSIDPITYELFQDMKKELPKNSAVYSWWDYGLAITDATGFPVFHSGMTQETPKTWAIAKSLVERQSTLYNISSYLDTYGLKEFYEIGNISSQIKEIQDNKSIKNKDEAIANLNKSTLDKIENRMLTFEEGPRNESLYLLLTGDMIDKYGAFNFLANSKNDGMYSFEQCVQLKDNNALIHCSSYDIEIFININEGKLIFDSNNSENINNLSIVKDGKIVSSQHFNTDSRFNVVFDLTQNFSKLYLMSNNVYNSAFTQLFMLNIYDETKFKLVKDNYPYGKVFHILKK